MPATTLNKTALRRALLADRQAIPAEVRREWDAAICARLLAWWNVNPVQSLGVYWPIRGEPDLLGTYEILVARGVQLSLPTVAGSDAPLRFVAWQPGDALVKDAMGVPVPADTHRSIQPNAVLAPCVGFNANNIRLGYGGGFYDRTLASLPRPLALGIAYECCRVEFHGDTHDIALDEILTEQSPLQFESLSL